MVIFHVVFLYVYQRRHHHFGGLQSLQAIERSIFHPILVLLVEANCFHLVENFSYDGNSWLQPI